MRIATFLAITLIFAGCTSVSSPASISAIPDLRRALGTSLPGTQGKTAKDQQAVDETVASGCAIGLWLPQECRRHNAVQ